MEDKYMKAQFFLQCLLSMTSSVHNYSALQWHYNYEYVNNQQSRRKIVWEHNMESYVVTLKKSISKITKYCLFSLFSSFYPNYSSSQAIF